tara:strand:+ start:143 stop:793 length:651 start_codon:yes stop_codon:yes gene_type:complete
MNRNRSLNEYRQTKDTVYQVPKYDPQTGEINPYYKELTGMDVNQTELDFYPEMQTDVDFVNEVEEFNRTFGKPNNYEPTIPEKKEWKFVYDFILEELEEYRQACENGDIVEILDALCDITYVSLGNGVMLHGLKDKIWPAYQEVQASNMSKSCVTEKEAMETVTLRAKEQAESCHFEQVGDRYVVYRSRDKKVMKSINYFRPNLTQFFTKNELDNV